MRKNKKKDAQEKNRFELPKTDYFNFEVIQEYFLLNEAPKDAYTLSDRAAEDLDFHDFFKYVDRTQSAVGQQYLYDRLRRLNTHPAQLEALEDELDFYAKDRSRFTATQKILKTLSSSNDYYFPFLIYAPLPPKMKYFWMIRLLQVLSLVCAAASFVYPVFSLPFILILGINVFLHYWHKARIGNFAAIFSRLIRLSKTATKLLKYANQSEVEKAALKKKIDRVNQILSKVFLLKTEELQASELTSIIWYLFELFKIATLAEITTFHAIVDDIEGSRKEIEALYVFIGTIDMRCSIINFRSGLKFYSSPVFIQKEKTLALEALYHPLVENCVENDLHLQHKSLLLTGSNMSGKTTFIRTINLNLIAAQTMNTSFSKKYRAPILAIASSIRIADDLKEGKSYYMEEVAAIGALITHAQEEEIQFLFTIDEVFKGTNTIERISAAKAILEYLNRGEHLVLVTTHDIELTNFLASSYQLHYFQESIANEELSFDYKLKQGALQKKNALKILEIAGYPEEVLAEAQRLTVKFEQEKTGLSKS